MYKIIDLGYAKSLFDASILHSFVGTMQYLVSKLQVHVKQLLQKDTGRISLVVDTICKEPF